MGFDAGTGNAIFYNPAEIISLMRVNEGVMHTDIRQAAGEDQRINLQSAQQDFQISAVKSRIAPFLDQIVTGAKVKHIGCNVGFGVAVETVNILVPVQLAAKINKIGAVIS